MISQKDLSILGTFTGTLCSTLASTILLCQRHYPKGDTLRSGSKISWCRHVTDLAFTQGFISLLFFKSSNHLGILPEFLSEAKF